MKPSWRGLPRQPVRHHLIRNLCMSQPASDVPEVAAAVEAIAAHWGHSAALGV